MRLNAFLSSCGVASRRKSEKIILEGRVRVNDKIVLAPFFDVNPEKDEVKISGKILKLLSNQEHVYYVINKPTGYVCASSDKYDPVVVDLIPENKRLFTVGRLDRESEGLLIITNDGIFTQSILHPSKEIKKTYEALLNHEINSKQIEIWKKGFDIKIEKIEKSEKRKVLPVEIKILNREPKNQWVSIVIIEGLKREVRLMAKQMGFSVEKLIRRKIGKMTLENLKPGEFVSLSFSELYTKIFNGGSVEKIFEKLGVSSP